MLAWKVLCASSAWSNAACWMVGESETKRSPSAANSDTVAMTTDKPWTSEWQLCVWCARRLAASVTTVAKAWHRSCCCSASRHGPAYLDSVAVCQVTSMARHTTVSYSSRDATQRCCTRSLRQVLWTACAVCGAENACGTYTLSWRLWRGCRTADDRPV